MVMKTRKVTKPDLTPNGPSADRDGETEIVFGTNAAPADEAPDPFDPARCRRPAADDAALGVRELLVSVPYRPPSREQFIRVHPDPAYRCPGGLIELKDDGESYWVDPALWPHLAGEPTFVRRLIVTTVTRQALAFLWGLQLPGNDGRSSDWVAVPLEAARAAETHWVKLYWDQSQRRHRINVSEHIDDEPQWPTQTFRELIRLAFKERVITILDHPILKRLRGEV
jgi:hypothetical protein